MKSFKMSFEDIIEIYITLEQNIQLDNLIPVHAVDVRDMETILRALQGYLGQRIVVEEVDFYQGIPDEIPVRTRDFYSFVHIFDAEEKYVEIVVNSHVLPDGKRLVNDCWSRFSVIKEACQAVIRQIFFEESKRYPSTDSVIDTATLFHNLVKYKFSIEDFDNASYPADIKIENAAEILAILLFYPAEKMLVDKAEVANNSKIEYENNVVFGVFDNDFFEIAKRYMIPERYVDLFLSSDIPEFVQKKLIAANVAADSSGDEDEDLPDNYGPKGK